jgi:hypothetical protein
MNDVGLGRAWGGVLVIAYAFATACGARPQPPADHPGASAASANPATPRTATSSSEPSAKGASSASSLDALPPPDTDTGAQSRRSLSLSEGRTTVDPSSNAIPSPPAKIDTPPQAGVEAAIKAVPSTIPIGNMSKNVLEAPLRDRARFEHCRIPYGTHGEIAAVVYNGAALGVDVKSKPNDRALNFCIERAVRQMTWVKELAVNRVTVPF